MMHIADVQNITFILMVYDLFYFSLFFTGGTGGGGVTKKWPDGTEKVCRTSFDMPCRHSPQND
jgi:hypothetical protein